jgi:hypothetical protein
MALTLGTRTAECPCCCGTGTHDHRGSCNACFGTGRIAQAIHTREEPTA